MFKRVTSWLFLRRLARDHARIADLLDRQNALLLRLADHFAPLPSPPPAQSAVRAETGVDYLDPMESWLAAAFVERTQAHTGHTPSDEEILIYLADEKTRDLAARLTARDEELTRLEESRL